MKKKKWRIINNLQLIIVMIKSESERDDDVNNTVHKDVDYEGRCK